MTSRSSRWGRRSTIAVALISTSLITPAVSHAGTASSRDAGPVYHSALVVEGAWDSRVGHDGSYFVTGTAVQGGMPSTPGAYVEPDSNGEGAFVTSYDPTGRVAWQLTFGGGVRTQGDRIAVGDDGSVYVTGDVNQPEGFPTTPGAMSRHYQGVEGDTFLAKFSPDGSRLVYATILPGVFSATDLEVDDQGRAVLTGGAYDDLPTTPGALQATPPAPQETAGYVVEVKPDGSDYRSATYLPGSDGSSPRGVELTSDGDVVVAGTTYSDDYPTTPGAMDVGTGNGPFASVLSADGTALVASARFGSGHATQDSVFGLTVSDDSLWLNGFTGASDFPTTTGALFPDKPAGMTRPMWVARLPLTLDSYGFATYLPTQGGGEIHAAPDGDAAVQTGRLPSDFPRPGVDARSAFLFLHPDGSLQGDLEPETTPRDFDVDRAGSLYTMTLVGTADRTASKAHRAVLGRYARCTIRGTAGDDVLRGTRGPDVICGRGGDDVLVGLGSYDVLLGGRGDDVLRGGRGVDVLFGGRGHDRLAGEGRRDLVAGGPGSDRVAGGDGPDSLRGGDGRDVVNGGSGRDHCGDPQRATRFRGCENQAH